MKKFILSFMIAHLTSTASAAYDLQCTVQGPRTYPVLNTRDIRVDGECTAGSYNQDFSIYIDGSRWTTYQYNTYRDSQACERARRALDGIIRGYLLVEFRPSAAQGENFAPFTLPHTENNVRVLSSLVRRDEVLETRITDLEARNQALFSELCDKVGRARRRELACP